MRCIIYSPHWLRTILLFVVKSAFYIFTLAWGFRRCSFRLAGQCEGLYTVERVTELAPRFHLYILTFCKTSQYGSHWQKTFVIWQYQVLSIEAIGMTPMMSKVKKSNQFQQTSAISFQSALINSLSEKARGLIHTMLLERK